MGEVDILATKIAHEIMPAIRAADSQIKASTDLYGTVVVDAQHNARVLIDGAEEAAPASSTVSIHHGDRVICHIVDRRLVVFANLTDPSVSNEDYEYVKNMAEEANDLLDGVAAAAAQADKTVAEILAEADTASSLVDDMQAAALAANTTLTDIYQDAEDAKANAAIAQESADSALESLQSVVQGATTVEKAVSVMQTALEAVVDYDPLNDTTQEWFWHDANGAHVLGDTSGYRNDINSTGMDIKAVAMEKSVAKFGSSGAQIGLADESHVEIDYHSLQMRDKWNNAYCHISDRLDSSGTATIQTSFTADGEATSFAVAPQAVNGNSIAVTVLDTENTDVTSSCTITKTQSSLTIRYTSGQYSQDPLPKNYKVNISYSTSAADAKAFTLGLRNPSFTIGGMSHATGIGVVASGYASDSSGYYSNATGYASHSEGYMSGATGLAAHSEGYDTDATLKGAHSEGEETQALGRASHSEGRASKAKADYAHAEGWQVTADSSGCYMQDIVNGEYGEAYTQAENDYGSSHAEGYRTETSGSMAHSEGFMTQASGAASHSSGSKTVASGTASTAMGVETIAASRAQTVMGQCNVEDDQGVYALIVGNGPYTDQRSNALAVGWGGTVEIPGQTMGYCGDGNPSGIQIIDPANIPLSQDAAVSTSTYGDMISVTDMSNGLRSTRAHVRMTSMNDGYQGIQLETSRRMSNDSYVHNGVRLEVNASGTRRVVISEQAPWRTALGLKALATKDNVTASTSAVTATAKNSSAVSANANFTVDVPVDSASGYKCIACICVSSSGASQAFLRGFDANGLSLGGTNTIKTYWRTTAAISANAMTVTVQIMTLKESLT